MRSFLGLIFPGWGGQESARQRWSGWSASGFLPGSSVDYEGQSGPLWLNGTASACLSWLADELPQSRLVVERARPDQTLEPVPDHPLVALLERPNRHLTGEQLWQSTLVDFVLDGNAYWLTLESRAGDVVEVWPLDPQHVEPQWPSDGSAWISHYLYQPEGTAYRLPIERVVHFRDRPDPANRRKGIGRVRAVLREVCADNEAATYTYALLKNLGQSGVVISADGAGLTDDQAEALVRQLTPLTTGDRRFRPIATSIPVKTSRLGESPEALKLDVIPKHIEARICAAIGVSPMVLGLPCAKDFSTYANAEQAARGSWSRLQAIQRNLAAAVRTQLLPRLDPDPKLHVGWDWTDVPALQTNAKELAARATLLAKTQVLTRREARELLGYAPLGDHSLDDVFVTQPQPSTPAATDAPQEQDLDTPAQPGRGHSFSPRETRDDPWWTY